MAKLSIKAATTSKSVLVFVQDSSATTGIGLSGLLFNTSSLIAYYCQPGVTGATAITLATLAATTSAFSSGGFKEIDATNMKGVYRLDIPNAALTGATSVVVMLSGAANMAPVLLEIELTATDNQDATRGGMTALPSANAGASGGLVINGSNTGTVTLAALTVSGATIHTGNVSMAGGLTLAQSSANASALSITGNGTGHGISATSGSGATGNGINVTSSATNGTGLSVAGAGTGSGLATTGGATGVGHAVVGGATSGAGMTINTTSGDGLSVTPTAGSALVLTANGTSKHGAVVTGGTAGTSDGVKAVAGSGGVPIRGDITGNVTGNVSGSVGSVTGNVGGSTASIANAPANWSSSSIDSNGNYKIQGAIKKNTAVTNFGLKMILTSDHLSGATGKTVTCQRSIDGAAFANCNTATATEIANGFYYVPLAAADVNGNNIIFRATATSCDPTEILISTQP